MIISIPVSELTVGMHIHKIPCSWTDHPFMKNSFTLDSAKQINAILATGVKEVSIDSSKGLASQISNAHSKNPAKQKNTNSNSVPAEKKSIDKDKKPNRQNALSNAQKVCDSAKESVKTMFSDVRMGKALDVEGVTPVVDSISSQISHNNNIILSVARLKTQSDYTYMHSVAVCGLMVALAKNMGLNAKQVQEAGVSGLLHDVGKVAIDDKLLNKAGKLNDIEFEKVKLHTIEGHKLLQLANAHKVSLDVCLHHHEKIDGTGYPHGLRDKQISIYARMGAICDVYDAVTSTRPYNEGWDPGLALKRMASWKGHFDKAIFNKFVQCLGIYPIGTLVRLSSGYLAVVMEQNENNFLCPTVKQFYSIKSKAMSPIKIVNLSRQKDDTKIESIEKASKWHINVPEDLWM